ncbi:MULTISPECIES: Wzz/FepE/Etk N-terminal domain-containing protein [unclassified Francisella]|uniref:Wzz/FepE/Etk N-terminal domain-containing protein n=1 Tax=unclassified Francisella TaxID=2610885 RepID=UPI002E310D4C|nr:MULTISPECIES: Wzz/FepE/Etk N-terminal domain-containing protein [unclassified Francisella]MED7820386.1 Wzz/FepE/Etk N-terminal domain-containing protein [Francisella sp. 19S2-4]MED7831221.1 Wzz/FepE/Etk N-terminal domain-containing protein [Francisella sp. 19S2-10]
MNKIAQNLKKMYKLKVIYIYKKLSKLFKTTSLRKNTLNKTQHLSVVGKKILEFIKKHSFISLVVIPTIIAAFYFIFLATPRYESTALVSLNQNNTAAPVDSTLSSLLGGNGGVSTTHSYLLINYIQSPQMLYFLQKDLNIKAMYQSNNVDFFSRLSDDADDQDFLKYYKKMIAISYDEQSNAITINVQGFTAIQAKEVLNDIVKRSQDAIDYISHTLAENRMKFNREQLDEIKKRAIDAQDQLIEFQNKKGIVDPESSVTSRSTVIADLKGKLSTAETKLTNLKSYMNPESSEIKATEQEILALKTQIDREKTEFLAEDPNNKNSELGDLVSNYQWLKLNAEFTMTEYQSALQSFEMAKLDSQSQQSFLVDIVKPTLPDYPQYPTTMYNLITIFIILSALYGLGRMIVTIIIENR